MAKKMQLLAAAVRATTLTYRLVSVGALLAGTVLSLHHRNKRKTYREP